MKTYNLNIYQRVFNIFNTKNKNVIEESHKNFLMGFFFIFVFNDPLIRWYVKTYNIYASKKYSDLNNDWENFIDSYLTEWTYEMF